MDVRLSPLLHSLTEWVGEQLGLHFAPDRVSDLHRGITAAARDLGFPTIEAFAEFLLSRPLGNAERDVLAGHLTIGETYFFRDQAAFDAVQQRVLPELINARRGRDQHVRIWSAACCSGEEAYSLAICVRRAVPDLLNWRISILGTDINPVFLQKAVRGEFSEWSFRATPPDFKDNHFTPTGGGRWQIRPEIRRMVSFSPLNLAGDVYPSVEHGTQGVDLIFCRNALIYFAAERAARVVHNLGQCLTESGWLVLGPNEVSHASTRDFSPVQFPGCILHRKGPMSGRSVDSPVTFTEVPITVAFEPETNLASPIPGEPLSEPAMVYEKPQETRSDAAPMLDFERAKQLYDRGQSAAAAALLGTAAAGKGVEPRVLILLARALANHGELIGAVAACDRVLADDKMNPTAHYLRASILQELGELLEAGMALKRALYLEPNFVLAHFALGNLSRIQGNIAESNRHFDNALTLARARQPDEILPEADGLTAGRLAGIISALRSIKAVA